MRALVLSDSHSSLRVMRRSIEILRPDVLIHLGDHYDDGEAMKEEFPSIPLIQVPGNCDLFRCPPGTPETILTELAGVKLFLTHGHRHGVKRSLGHLLLEARKSGANAVLYGHTHVPHCEMEDGLWILNPGSCGHGDGTVGLLELENGKIISCRILRQDELEDTK